MVYQPFEPPNPQEQALGDIMCRCHASTPPQKDDTCKSLGDRKHECCDNAIKRSGNSSIGGEQGYSPTGAKLSQTRTQLKASGGLKGTLWPDACALDGGNPTKFYDFKFVCPPGVPNIDERTGKITYAQGKGSPGGDFYIGKNGQPSQFEKYKKLGKKLKPPVSQDPMPLESSACR